MRLNSGLSMKRASIFIRRDTSGPSSCTATNTPALTSFEIHPAKQLQRPSSSSNAGAEPALYYPFGENTSTWRLIRDDWRRCGDLPSKHRPGISEDPLQGNFDTFFESSRGSGLVGGGVKHPITKSLGFRADAGGVFTKVPTFGLPTSSINPTHRSACRRPRSQRPRFGQA
jgi:hypothetical protein